MDTWNMRGKFGEFGRVVPETCTRGQIDTLTMILPSVAGTAERKK